MQAKLVILTTVVALLAFLSVYGVYGYRELPADLTTDQTFLADSTTARLQTAYILPLAQPNYRPIYLNGSPNPALTAKASLLYDTRYGKVLWADQTSQTLPIASLTKIMTAIIVQERLDPQKMVKIEPDMQRVDGESADFRLGETLYVKDLLAAMLVKSSNDAAIALARTVEDQTKRGFKDLMNQKAQNLGLIHSLFFDPAGLDDAAYSTAEDLLQMVLAAKRYPLIWYWLRQPAVQITSADGQFTHFFSTTNRLLDGWPEVLGGKTGYTDGALGCMILEVELADENSSLIAIVLGSSSRFEDTRALIEWGKTAWRWK